MFNKLDLNNINERNTCLRIEVVFRKVQPYPLSLMANLSSGECELCHTCAAILKFAISPPKRLKILPFIKKTQRSTRQNCGLSLNFTMQLRNKILKIKERSLVYDIFKENQGIMGYR